MLCNYMLLIISIAQLYIAAHLENEALHCNEHQFITLGNMCIVGIQL